MAMQAFRMMFERHNTQSFQFNFSWLVQTSRALCASLKKTGSACAICRSAPGDVKRAELSRRDVNGVRGAERGSEKASQAQLVHTHRPFGRGPLGSRVWRMCRRLSRK